MASLVSTLDILKDALQKSGELQTASSPYFGLGLTYLNTVYRDVVAGTSHFAPDTGEPFVWARSPYPGTFTIKAPYSLGGVTCTQGSDVVIMDTPPAFALDGYFLQIVGRQEFFRVIAFAPGSNQFQIDLPYPDTTITTAQNAGYYLHKLDYTIGVKGAYVRNPSAVVTPGTQQPAVPYRSISRLVEPFKVDRPQSFDGDGEGLIYGIDSQSFARNYPRFATSNGVPVRFTVINEIDGQYTIRMNKSSLNFDCRCEYDYIPVPDELTAEATSIPIFPVEDRPFLSYATTYHIMLDKSDSRSDAYWRLAQAKLQSMISERRRELMKTGSKMSGRLMPRTEQLQFALIRSASGLRF